jgi:type IV secretion system protein VirB9
MTRSGWHVSAALSGVLICWPGPAHVQEATSPADLRIRTVDYSAEAVYRLRGFIGYQIDVEFESGESFQGLGAGDVEGLAFAAQGNHLFIKPRANSVRTNLTVLTTRRAYRFEYTALAGGPESAPAEVVFALRFRYTPSRAGSPPVPGADIERQFSDQSDAENLNRNYWYCGPPGLKPLKVEDDGVHTRLRFDPRAELPALFVRDEDGGESLLNFNVEHGDVVVHRVARQFVLRRGRLVGCVLNKGFVTGGRELATGTVAPTVERATRGAGP